MEKVREFRAKAKGCREHAEKAMDPSIKEHFLRSADLWEKLAEEHLNFFVRFPDRAGRGRLRGAPDA